MKEKGLIRRSMYFGNISLYGFRAFKDETIIDFTTDNDVPAQWTVILGENGTSKTGVLQAIASTVPVYDQKFINQMERSDMDKPDGWIPRASSETNWINWWATNKPRNRRLLKDAIGLNTKLYQSSEGINQAKPLTDVNWYTGVTFLQSNDSNLKCESTFSGHDFEDFNIEVYSYAATRLVTERNDSNLTKYNNNTIFNDYNRIHTPEDWLLKLDYLRRIDQADAEKKSAEVAFQSAVRCLIKVLPDIEDIKIEKTKGILNKNSEIRAQFKCPFGWVFFEELGQGYKAMASWAVDLLKKLHHQYSNLDKPETGAAVVLIDEFDLHLHPKWQFGIMDHLSSIFTNCQFIVTAHSPLLVQGANSDTNLVVLKQEEDEEGVNWIVADSDPVHVRGWRLDQIITSDLFGFDSARPAGFTELFEKRDKLVSKTKRSREETDELKSITKKLEKEAPPSISNEANEILKELNLLKK